MEIFFNGTQFQFLFLGTEKLALLHLTHSEPTLSSLLKLKSGNLNKIIENLKRHVKGSKRFNIVLF